jgi:hypothetical protein
MEFSKEEIKNIISMLLSEDKDNTIIAFGIMNNFNKKKHLGELLVIYQFGRTKLSDFKENCKKCFNILIKTLLKDEKNDNFDYRVPSSKVFNKLIENNCSQLSIELYLELLGVDLSDHLYAMGYATDKLNINIKLKDNE